MHGIRSFVFAALLTLSAPAVAATTLTVSGAPVDGGVVIGATNVYVVTITNTGGEAATGVQLTDATFPPELELTDVNPCALPRNQVPCTLPDIAAGESLTVEVSAAGIIPDPAPTECGPVAIGDTTFSAAAANAPEVTSAAIANDRQPYTDLQISWDGPASLSANSQYTLTATVTNAGPCDVLEADGDAVYAYLQLPLSNIDGTSGYTVLDIPVECYPDPGLTLEENIALFIDPNEYASGNECFVGDLAVAATYSMSFQVATGGFADDIERSTYYTTGDVYNDVMQEGDAGNNTSTLASVYEDVKGSCSTAGGGLSLLSVLPLLAARAWRRRKSA